MNVKARMSVKNVLQDETPVGKEAEKKSGKVVAEVAIDETNFPDAKFREVVKQYDRDKNGSFSQEEIADVTEINCSEMSIFL